MCEPPGSPRWVPERPMAYIGRHSTSKLATGLALALAAGLLGLVFALYCRADFMLQLANQLWSCF